MRSRPNILLVVADDHAANAVGCYGGPHQVTPCIDRVAAEGIRFDACGCTNSLCSPSRATILTGTYNHRNGVTTLSTEFDHRQPTFPEMLQESGYRTALFGKWHLGHGGVHDPRGFDAWEVLPDQGEYVDPEFLAMDGSSRVRKGYATDLITDLALDWLGEVEDGEEPWCLLVQHKAPHRPWVPAARHADLFDEADIVAPETFFDNHDGHSRAAADARMRVARDLNLEDLKQDPPDGLEAEDAARWALGRYLVDYLRCVVAVDENVGRLLDHLDATDQAGSTVVVYTSDQGFFLGEHGWYDKRFMYRESLQMPLVVRCPDLVSPGTASDALVLNVDFAQTFLDLAGVEAHPRMQGRSMVPSTSTAATASRRTAGSGRLTGSSCTTTGRAAASPAPPRRPPRPSGSSSTSRRTRRRCGRCTPTPTTPPTSSGSRRTWTGWPPTSTTKSPYPPNAPTRRPR